MIKRRNLRLEHFFSGIFKKKDFKVFGDENSPCIVYKNKRVLSCFVHNFDLIFTDRPRTGEHLYTHPLKYPPQPFDRDFVDRWFKECVHREVFTIRVKDTHLRVAGWNFLKPDKTDPKGKYPVFSQYKFKIYFSKERCEEIIKDYSTDELLLEIV